MNQQRYIEIEEEKLAIMRENLEIEKRKLELLEQYVQWRVETPADHFVTPSVSPTISTKNRMSKFQLLKP